MKIPIEIVCHTCNKEHLIWVDIKDMSITNECDCGDCYSGYFDCNFTVGHKIIIRCQYEFAKKDFPLSIVFSATAFECELSRLYFKWKIINALPSGITISDSKLEELLRKYRSIEEKIEGVCKLMHAQGFTRFVNNTPELRKIVIDGFPSLQLSQLSLEFQKHLFWPRNRVLHLADTTFKEEDAIKCFSIATLGLKILGELDKQKRNI